MTPPMTNDLIERLNMIVAELQGLPHVVQTCREAAAHIEALADELARLQSDASEIMAANTELATENTALAERVRELEGALDLATADRTTYYLRCAHRRLETIAEAMPDDLGLSLGNLALADERDWLDCHIDWLERTARQGRKDKENG